MERVAHLNHERPEVRLGWVWMGGEQKEERMKEAVRKAIEEGKAQEKKIFELQHRFAHPIFSIPSTTPFSQFRKSLCSSNILALCIT